MTNEEKAKAYDEALKRASIAYKDEDRHLKATLEMIFPELNEINNPYARLKNMIAWLEKYSIHNKDNELKEYDDEMIRKEIISVVEQYVKMCERESAPCSPEDIDKWFAWLEKQGSKPNWCHHKVDLSNCSEEYRKAYYDGWNNCNQQHSQCESEKK